MESVLEQNAVYRDHIKRERELAAKEAANADKALELARQETELVRKELGLEKQRGDFYESAYKTVTKGRSKKCWVAKILTIGLARCK